MAYEIFLKDNTRVPAKSITLEEYEDLEHGQQGICIACGEVADGCEPDARGHDCEVCNEPQVFGAGELLIMGLVK